MDFTNPIQKGTPYKDVFRTERLNLWTAGGLLARRQNVRPTVGVPGAGVDGSLTVLVRNDTGGDLDEFSVLALGAPLVDVTDATGFPLDFQGRPFFPGTAPAASTDPFAVTVEAIPAGSTGKAVVQGLAVCDVNFASASDLFAGPAAGNTDELASGSGPARVVYKEAGTGVQRAVVLLGLAAPPTVYGPTPATLTLTGASLLTGSDFKVPAGESLLVVSTVRVDQTAASGGWVLDAGIGTWADGSSPPVNPGVYGYVHAASGLASGVTPNDPGDDVTVPIVALVPTGSGGLQRVGVFYTLTLTAGISGATVNVGTTYAAPANLSTL